MTVTSDRLISADALEDLARQIFEAAGTPPDIAAVVSESLVSSNRFGVDSHGCIRIPQYLQGINAGRIDPNARPSVAQDGPLTLVDGNQGFGQFAARALTEATITAAREYGVGVSTLHGVMHIGRLGEYAETVAESGLVAILGVQRRSAWRQCSAVRRARSCTRHQSALVLDSSGQGRAYCRRLLYIGYS